MARPKDLTVDTCIRRHTMTVLRLHKGNIVQAADTLGVPRRTVQRWLRKWGYKAKRWDDGMPRRPRKRLQKKQRVVQLRPIPTENFFRELFKPRFTSSVTAQRPSTQSD